MLINLFYVIIVSGFLALLFLNIYFRVKVFKNYKYLVQNRIEFDATHMLNQERLEKEIIAKYPKHKKQIQDFVDNIRFSMKCASAIIVLMTVFAAVLMFVLN